MKPQIVICRLFSNDGQQVYGFRRKYETPVTNVSTVGDINYVRRLARTQLIARKSHTLWTTGKSLPACVADKVMRSRRAVLTTPQAMQLREQGWTEDVIINVLVPCHDPLAELVDVNWELLIAEGYIRDPLITIVGGYSVLHTVQPSQTLVDDFLYSVIGRSKNLAYDQLDWWEYTRPHDQLNDLDHNFFGNVVT